MTFICTEFVSGYITGGKQTTQLLEGVQLVSFYHEHDY